MPGKIRPGRLVADALDSAVGNTAVRAHEKRRGLVRRFTHGGEFRCACSPGRTFHGHREMNAHHLARHGNYWAGAKAKGVGRKIGKQADAMRKHARGWLEAHGHVDRMGNRTDKARSRPQAGGHLSTRHLRSLHRHGRDWDKADRHDTRAARHRARDFHGPAEARQRLAANLRGRWPVRQPRAARPAPARTPAPAAPARTTAPETARANGHRAETTRPLGRLAPSRPDRTRELTRTR